MSKEYKQVKDMEIPELAGALSLDDVDIEDDIREWLQTPPVELKQYGFGEADSEEEYSAILNEISDSYLTER